MIKTLNYCHKKYKFIGCVDFEHNRFDDIKHASDIVNHYCYNLNLLNNTYLHIWEDKRFNKTIVMSGLYDGQNHLISKSHKTIEELERNIKEYIKIYG